MSIYTRGGDKGQTSLLGGARVPKDSLRIEVYGTLDEATSTLGLARATTRHDDICRDIIELQGEFIGVMAELASGRTTEGSHGRQKRPAEVPEVRASQVQRLERQIDHYEVERIPSNQFVRPGGSPASAAIDMARTFVRRAERRLIALSREEDINPHLVEYFNRLSDLLYVMARIDEQREIERAVREQFQDVSEGKRGESARTHGDHGMTLRLSDCDRMIEAGIRRANDIGVPMVLAVVDAAGQLLESRRMDDALVVSVALAPNKAHTAATVRMPTHELAKLSQPQGPLFGIDANIPSLTLVGGGLPLQQAGRVLGAVGASGGSVDQDIEVAQAMLDSF
jgi:ATP:cob(I)alamin adenosyltransferase